MSRSKPQLTLRASQVAVSLFTHTADDWTAVMCAHAARGHELQIKTGDSLHSSVGHSNHSRKIRHCTTFRATNDTAALINSTQVQIVIGK